MVDLVSSDIYEETKLMISMPAGMRYKTNNGHEWVRMIDSIDYHIEGSYCNIETGEWKHASKIAKT